ncbi:MAG TPA: tetratricopeptide repeat protein [Bryobacteraceae bacterium]|jgi:tetratricopeptide (TPR) repeat protein|nr:tetratricopeptide repeat protein [Bryobacteraceae bacterium]
MATQADELISRAYTARREGRTEEGLELYRRAAEELRPANNPLRLAHTVRHVADILREVHEPQQARVHYEEALAIYRQHPEASGLDVANCLRGYGLALEELANNEAAADSWREAKRLYEDAGTEAGVRESEARLKRLTQAS